MTRVAFESYLCRPFCSFFREGVKEEMACQGGRVLVELVAQGRLAAESFPGVESKSRVRWEEGDRALERILCLPCPFAEDDCDFHSVLRSAETEPCGGYLLLKLLKEEGVITCAELDAVRVGSAHVA